MEQVHHLSLGGRVSQIFISALKGLRKYVKVQKPQPCSTLPQALIRSLKDPGDVCWGAQQGVS